MFVDDSDFPLYVQAKHVTIESITYRQQDTVNSWSYGLAVSGGSLKPDFFSILLNGHGNMGQSKQLNR